VDICEKLPFVTSTNSWKILAGPGGDRNVCVVTTTLNHRLARFEPAVLSLFRLVYGLLFAGEGSLAVFGWPVHPVHPVAFGAWPGWYAGLIEFAAGLLIAAGLHQPRSLWPIGEPPAGNGGTLAILFCFGFFLLVFTGGGSYSIDALRRGGQFGGGRR